MTYLHFDVTGVDPTLVPALAAGVEAMLETLRSKKAPAVGAEPVHAWTIDLARWYTGRLEARHPDRVDVLRAIVASSTASVNRATVLEIADRTDAGASLSSYTRPSNGLLRRLMADGHLPPGAADPRSPSNPLRPWYADGPGKATDFFMESDLVPVFAAAFTPGKAPGAA